MISRFKGCSLGKVLANNRHFEIAKANRTQSKAVSVYYELRNNEDKPEFSNRRFYPCKKDIRNHFRLTIAARKLAKKDQDHLKLLVDEWKASVDSQDKFLFRPYVAAKKFGIEAGGSKA